MHIYGPGRIHLQAKQVQIVLRWILRSSTAIPLGLARKFRHKGKKE